MLTKLAVPLDFEVFVDTVEKLERSHRAEYIFENLKSVLGGDYAILLKYAVEARMYWEKRCCTMLEYQTPNELYQTALNGELPKLELREKEVILRLARTLRDESKLSDIIAPTDETSVSACYRAEALLKHINNKHELLSVYIHFSYALRRQNAKENFISVINHKALILAEELGAKDEEMQVLINFGRMYDHNLDYTTSIQYYKRSLGILDTIIVENNINDSPNTIPNEYLLPKAILLYYIAHCNLYLGDVRNAVTLGNQAATFAEKLQKDSIIIYIHQLLSRAYGLLGAHHTALEHLLLSRSIAEMLNSQSLIGATKLMIAATYTKLGEHQKAIEYGQQAILISEQYESLAKHLAISSKVGSIMIEASEYDLAHELFEDLLAIIENADKSINLATQKSVILRHLAGIAVHRKLWDDALAFIEYPLQHIEGNLQLSQIVIDILSVATDIHIGLKQYDKARDYAFRNLKISAESNALQNQYTAHKHLAIIAEIHSDFTTAYHHHKEFHRLKEQVFNDESDKRNKNMMILLEQQEAVRSMQAERIRRFELEDEIGQLSTALVHREQALKEIRSTLRLMKSTNQHAMQVVEVLQTVIRSTENVALATSSKTYKQVDEKIETTFPSLTKIQRELCRFIALGHSTKDIAGLMNISAQSVNTQRYRIRTRLGLSEAESLDFVIKQAVKIQ